MRVLASLNHPNIVRYYETFVDEKSGRLQIVMEYCEVGSTTAILPHHILYNGQVPGLSRALPGNDILMSKQFSKPSFWKTLAVACRTGCSKVLRLTFQETVSSQAPILGCKAPH